MLLAGKVAVVTGGASGIGLAISQRFAREGALVAVWDIDEAGAQRVTSELVASGGKAIGCRVDVSNREHIEAATQRVRAELGAVSILVNNVPPGFVDTPLLRATLSDERVEVQIQASPMKRAGRPEDIAAACAFLASEEAGYITAHTFSVNGGRYSN
jgi:2-hydroxycyclohexanecarboxyl-CoA dehydrogenase